MIGWIRPRPTFIPGHSASRRCAGLGGALGCSVVSSETMCALVRMLYHPHCGP